MKIGGVRLRAQTLSLAVAIMLAACGGGDDGGVATPAPPPVTPVPETLAVTAPAGAESATELQFNNSAASLSGLTFSWDFGDGKTSTEANPKHAYAKGGSYEVVLKVSNTAGASREQRVKVSITNLNNVKGLVCSGANDTGWCWQQPLPTGNTRYGTYFTSATTVITVGENGEIFKSTDAGATWTALRSGLTTPLRAVAFTSAQDGWIVGDYGALLRSSDGGSTWALSKIPDTNDCCSVTLRALDAQRAFLGDGRYTLDGGKTWGSLPSTSSSYASLVSPMGVIWRLDYSGNLSKSTDFGLSNTAVLETREAGSSIDYSAISQVDEKTVFVSVALYRYDTTTYSYTYKQLLWRTVDGGASWTKVEPKGLNSGYSAIVRMLRTDDTSWLGVANGGLVRSTDSGQNWTSVKVSDNYYSLSYNELLVSGKTLLLPGYQALLRSVDGGATWSKATISGSNGSYENYYGLRQVEGDVFSMRDSQGRFYISTDAGLTWKLAINSASGNIPSTPASLAFLDSKRGLMLTAQGELSETKDGGKTWAVKLPGMATGSDFQLQFVNDKTGWMLVADGRLYKTVDGGASWGAGALVRSNGLSAISFTDENRGWSRARYSGTFMVTADGGKSWSDFSVPNSTYGLHLINDQQVVAYGYGGLIATSADAGKTWTHRFSGTSSSITKIVPSDSKTLWAIGNYGVLIRSDDQGATWSSAVLGLGGGGGFNDIAFADARTGWVVGTAGTIFATTDGGKTWARQATGTARDLRKVMPVDGKTAWVAGDYGILLATGNGGF